MLHLKHARMRAGIKRLPLGNRYRMQETKGAKGARTEGTPQRIHSSRGARQSGALAGLEPDRRKTHHTQC